MSPKEKWIEEFSVECPLCEEPIRFTRDGAAWNRAHTCTPKPGVIVERAFAEVLRRAK